ncbi:restriction endonuclease subunit S [Virgibacillus salinus]|uniref:Type I restriction modification DNA specificity domain-containing protein n=1 Tax=Virgibacillus salinus TaxID=553311 RepID=A0A1H1GMN2_9BACI|nr:restriction endonuclease subunit S [Virgibacillus salinus]SDR14484.1 Type I restriction modification DNA specificity domain-containing protein [Virgibacillus salinus]
MNDVDWKDFQIGGENGVFSITSSTSEIDKNKLNQKPGKIPYVTRSELNNGIDLFITKDQDEKYQINKGNVITIGLDTQTVFYQSINFYTGQNIQILEHKKMTKNIACFLIPLLKEQMEKFNWGGNGATLKRLKNTRIMLPVNNLGEIDFEHMENTGRKMYKESHEYLSEYILQKHNRLAEELQNLDILTLEDRDWLPFSLDDLFPKLQRGKRLTIANQVAGHTPYISSTALNNGVDSFIGNKNNVRTSAQDITIANSGSVGNAFYHPYNYVASDHVHSLNNDKYNKHHYLFIVTLLNRLQDKYHFNYEINEHRLKNDKLMLPVNDEGNLDLDFMENYMKQMELRQLGKIKGYLV